MTRQAESVFIVPATICIESEEGLVHDAHFRALGGFESDRGMENRTARQFPRSANLLEERRNLRRCRVRQELLQAGTTNGKPTAGSLDDQSFQILQVACELEYLFFLEVAFIREPMPREAHDRNAVPQAIQKHGREMQDGYAGLSQSSLNL